MLEEANTEESGLLSDALVVLFCCLKEIKHVNHKR